MKESRTLEFKETVSKTFLKTVSAFSNYNGGEIIFGINDDGNIKGLSNPKNICLDIENSINDCIKPQPIYKLKINENDNTISLIVEEGKNKPYLYNSKAYKRNDTSTIEVDSYELTRLILEGKKINFEDLRSGLQELSFHYLEHKLRDVLNLETFNKDTLKTLNLYNDQEGFNNAANILSDNNTFPGIDIAVFGESINIIKKRIPLENISLLEMFDRAIDVYRDNYQYEEVEGSYRKKVQLIPEEAFREALANALIHRTWDTNAKIRISMFNEKVEIVSPGGLMNGITKDEYLTGMISLCRNPILSNTFYRLGIVEIFGTGIIRINNNYEGSLKKPIFNVSPNTIQVILPLFTLNHSMSNEKKEIFDILKKHNEMSIGEILEHTSIFRSTAKRVLKEMKEEGLIRTIGNGKSTRYKI